MGPRSCERGNHQATQIIGNDCFMLQWGRARASAEMAAPPHCVTSSKTASMGPRSCERGNMTGYPHGRPGYVIASMGPRSCERGNTRTLRYSCSAACWLQWGRARASAEIIAQRLIGLGVAELQWGRARASAEMTDPNKWGFYSYSFNGAALVRARKSPFLLTPARLDPSLQWGRARASAEIPARLAAGRNGAQGFNGAALVRARKSFSFIHSPPFLPCFNGAALVRARKSDSPPGDRQLSRRASMGPRSCERGNTPRRP